MSGIRFSKCDECNKFSKKDWITQKIYNRDIHVCGSLMNFVPPEIAIKIISMTKRYKPCYCCKKMLCIDHYNYNSYIDKYLDSAKNYRSYGPMCSLCCWCEDEGHL